MSEWSDRYSAVTKATRHGLLKKASEVNCERCGKQSTHRHHEDYSKPLEVVYLCSRCHKQRHKELGWGKSGKPRHYNFSRIPIGSYGLVPGETENVSPLAHNHSLKTGERFKCFQFDENRTAVFRLPDQALETIEVSPRRQRQKAGLCVACGGPLATKVHCAECASARREYQRRRNGFVRTYNCKSRQLELQHQEAA